MKLVSNNKKPSYTFDIDEMYIFYAPGSVSVEMKNIKSVDALFWYKDKDKPGYPVVMLTLKDGTHIHIEQPTIDEARQAVKWYKKQCSLLIVKEKEKGKTYDFRKRETVQSREDESGTDQE